MRAAIPPRELLEALRLCSADDASLADVHDGAVACLALLDALDTRSRLRNAGFTFRSLGDRDEPYPAWLRALRGQSGVYVIRDRASREILYVGQSSTGRIFETLTRHVQGWRRWKGFWRGQFAEGHDPGMTYPRGDVEVAVGVTRATDAVVEEARLIRKLKPRDNLLGAIAE